VPRRFVQLALPMAVVPIYGQMAIGVRPGGIAAASCSGMMRRQTRQEDDTTAEKMESVIADDDTMACDSLDQVGAVTQSGARLVLGEDAGGACLLAVSAAQQAAAPSAWELNARGSGASCSWGASGRRRRRWSRVPAVVFVESKRDLDACGVVTDIWDPPQNRGLN
jgi:hypothetical protein